MNFIIAALIRKTTTIVITEIINERKGAKIKEKRRGNYHFCLYAGVLQCHTVCDRMFSVCFIIVITIIFIDVMLLRAFIDQSAIHLAIYRFHLDMLYLFFSKLCFFRSFPVCALCVVHAFMSFQLHSSTVSMNFTCIYTLRRIACTYSVRRTHIYLVK